MAREDAGRPARSQEIESAASRLDPSLAEEFADRLTDKREKLQYFLVTAATAVIAFTFNDFNKKDGVLRQGPIGVILAGWAVLLACSGLALYGVRARHFVYSRAIDDMRGRQPFIGSDWKQIGRVQGRLTWAGHLMWAFFIAGTSLLATAYALAIV